MIRKRCPNGTRKNKKTGICVPVLKKIPEKSISKSPTLIPEPSEKKIVKRCPKGTRKNKKTGMCEPKLLAKMDVVSLPSPPLAEPVAPVTRDIGIKTSVVTKKDKPKRCPKGTRKNKVTGLCESKVVKTKFPTVIDIPPVEDPKLLSEKIDKTITDLKTKKEETLKKSLVMKKFDPKIHEELMRLNSLSPHDVYAYGEGGKAGCRKIVDTKRFEKQSNDALLGLLKKEHFVDVNYTNMIRTITGSYGPKAARQAIIKMLSRPIDTDKLYVVLPSKHSAKPLKGCINWKSKKLAIFMMGNLMSKKGIDYSKITSPHQYLSNCWFNTAFMTFFISDRARILTMPLRKNMINQEVRNPADLFNPAKISLDMRVEFRKMKGGKVDLEQLKKAFFVYNVMIDNSLRGVMTEQNNTNYVISTLYQASSGLEHFYGTNKGGNPVSFFNQMKLLLKDWNSSYYHLLTGLTHNHILENTFERLNGNWKKGPLNKPYFDGKKFIETPDCLIMEIYDKSPSEKSKYIKPEFTLSRKVPGKKQPETVTYFLDAAILRDNKKQHFTSYLTIGGKEYRFDGHTHSRLSPLKWKSLVTKDQEFDFTFDETPGKWKHLIYNFMKGYQLLFYYKA